MSSLKSINPNKTLKEEFENKFVENEHLDNANPNDLWQFIEQAIVQAQQETSKAYGGCSRCFGKGYSTERVGDTTLSPDFIGDKEILVKESHVEYHPCTCDRGKQFEEALTKVREEMLDEDSERSESKADIAKKSYSAGYNDCLKGRKKAPHDTRDGWCCACDYDLAIMEEKIRGDKQIMSSKSSV